jgi:hypothetical protein
MLTPTLEPSALGLITTGYRSLSAASCACSVFPPKKISYGPTRSPHDLKIRFDADLFIPMALARMPEPV